MLIGAVIYEPKVATIWEIIKQFFADEGCPIDYVFYSNYELQVQALCDGHIDIAWNSPLAWIDAVRRTGGRCRAIAMRDTDRDRVSHVVARKGHVTKLADLRGGTVACGAVDSPQATLIPLQVLRREGLVAGRDFTLRRFDVLVGKHGDHIGGERKALACLDAGEADAACVLDLNWQLWTADGTADATRLESIAVTPRFDHCNFTVLDRFAVEDEHRWVRALMRMRYDNLQHREMMDLEGLKAWLPGRTTGYEILDEATRDQGFFGDRS
jgi:ABC-type phosphate/phosphonate transport system substrate-binding protein